MNVFAATQNGRPAFLGQKQRRKSEGVSKSNVFGPLFAIFGTVLNKNGSFLTKMELF